MTKPLVLDYGATVFYQGKPYVISQESHDFSTVVIRDVGSGKLSQVAIVDLASAPEELPVTDFLAEGGCRVISNQLGYPKEQASIGFRNDLVVEL